MTSSTVTMWFMPIALVATLGRLIYVCASAGQRRALAWSERSGLPLPDSDTGEAVVARLRRDSIVEAAAVLTGVVAATPLILTPFADNGLLLLVAFLSIVLAISGAIIALAGLREHLFVPATLAPRVARLRESRGTDYATSTGRRVTASFAALASLAMLTTIVIVFAGATNTDRSVLVVAVLACTTGLCATVALPVLERAVLARAQPASTAVQLAWDDLLRVKALNAARGVAAALCTMGVVCTVSAVTGGAGIQNGLAYQVIMWTQIALQFFFPTNGRGLPENLRPDLGRRAHNMGATS